VQRDSQQGISSAFADLLAMPSQVLADAGQSRGRARRVCARLARVNTGEALVEQAGMTAAARTRGGPAPRRLAAKIHRHLQLSSITRAARAVDASPIAEPTAQVIAALRALHPHEALPSVPAITSAAPPVSAEIFTDVLRNCPGAARTRAGLTSTSLPLCTSTATL
jgi:hypothetical protein